MKHIINKILIFLRDIYPLYLCLLAFVPVIIGFFINYNLSDSRNFVINLLWIPLFIIPFLFTGQKIIYYTIVSLYYIAGFINIGHWVILKGPLTLSSLMVIANTNFQESVEFFDLKATGGLFIILPYSFCYILALKYKPSKQSFNSVRTSVSIILLLTSVSFISINAMKGRFIRKATPHIVKVGLSLVTKLNMFEEALRETDPKHIKASTSFTEPHQTFVLILGESCSRRHMSLYGAATPTTPRLEKRKDIIVFEDVISGYSNTIETVLSMLTNSSIHNKINLDKATDIIDIFHSSGFKTYWISNQSPIGVWDNIITVFAKKSDEFEFVNMTSSSSFESTLNTSYDEKVFLPFAEALKDDAPKKLIVLHLMGSHSSYAKRYPKEYEVFKGEGEQSSTIAAYHNSVLYNDFVVDSILNHLVAIDKMRYNNVSSAIYLSDHGENVYDEAGKAGHDYAESIPKINVEVPMFVWLSPGYLTKYPEKVKMISSNRQKPFVTDNLFHSILDLNGIKTPYLEEDRSIFHQSFNDRRKRILSDEMDYDKK